MTDEELSQKIFRIQEHILDTIKENGDISQFKEDVLNVIHFLLENQLTKEEITATAICEKNRYYMIQTEQRKRLEQQITELQMNLLDKDNRINELEKALDERFIHVIGARTVFARLMSLDKEIIVRDDLKLRNEIEHNIKDEEKLKLELKKKDKIIKEMAERVYLKKEEYECVRENQKRKIHASFEDCIIEYFEKKEG